MNWRNTCFTIAISAVSCNTFGADVVEFRSTVQLRKSGVKTCIGSMEKLSRFLYDADDYGYIDYWNKADPDKHSAAVFASKNFADGPSLSYLASTPNPV